MRGAKEQLSDNARRRIKWTIPWAVMLILGLMLGITAMWLYWVILSVAGAGHIVLGELERRQK